MNEKILDGTCIVLQSFLTLTQTDEIFRIVSLVLTILSCLVVLVRNIYNWYIEAKKDNKIDKDEIKDLIDIVGDGVNDIKDETKKGE